MSAPDITIEQMNLKYDSFPALQDINLKLEGNKIYALLGRNGSGKTSLLSVLSSFRPASSGSVKVGGEEVFDNEEATLQICFIRDEGNVYEEENAKKALAFASKFRPNWDAAYADQLMEKFKLPYNKKVSSFSRGMKSAMGAVIGLASRAPITIFDEAYLGMDAPSRYAFYEEILRDYMEHPRTIILSTHLIEEVESLFEEVVILDQGKILLHEKVDEFRDKGVAVTGSADRVDEISINMKVLSEKRLGPTKSVTLFGELDRETKQKISHYQLETGPVGLQDLFIHFTSKKEGDES
ncbi:ABC transporter ATP-binding protein [Xylanibacillus composti]|uniref:ABC transporter n=1 Tax=Xylanibacillus composti TaxID=1572762 RepID=A0A8J4H5U8_9BACL|nr:ABC transporter ATP-binding protein [Xylanibacillus composti]MDT9724584.1 ABC transporter ATP-binding protein [Xylanibacillus composti]GIQ70256.1 ABC transporter [Xylanibacillus composti]